MKYLNRNDLLYPELSYQLIGILFDVYNNLGYGYREKYYQRAIAEGLKLCGIKFQEQTPAIVNFHGKGIGRLFFDFVIEGKIILEIKKTDRFAKTEIEQLSGYLKSSGLKLGILAHFTKKEVTFKRIVNTK